MLYGRLPKNTQPLITLISGIEDELGCANVAEIIEASDGIVVARKEIQKTS